MGRWLVLESPNKGAAEVADAGSEKLEAPKEKAEKAPFSSSCPPNGLPPGAKAPKSALKEKPEDSEVAEVDVEAGTLAGADVVVVAETEPVAVAGEAEAASAGALEERRESNVDEAPAAAVSAVACAV